MKRTVVTLTGTVCLALLASVASAKLPPPSDEAKAKAAETAAKTAWTDKVGAFQLCKAQDRVAAAYLADAKKAGKDLKPTAAPPCTDPGPFAYTPPEQKPLESSGAHSPPGTATSPPSNKAPAAEQKPAAVKKS
jgi:hypothetical protein